MQKNKEAADKESIRQLPRGKARARGANARSFALCSDSSPKSPRGGLDAGAPSGVRAQAVAPDRAMVDDFLVAEDARAIHVNNAFSPAAAAALQIGKPVAERALSRFV